MSTGAWRNESVIDDAISRVATITAVLDLAIPHPAPWPAVVGDGRHLPWRDGAVDVIVANAVIEHVGGEDDQRMFMAEHSRAARLWVVTTPNKWFPVESHTSAVLKHWSPKWRATRPEFTRLLSLREFRQLLPPGTRVMGHWWSPTFVAFSA